MPEICPCCRLRDARTRDHVFSDFLGGSKKIPVCKTCNDAFGQEFEARVSRELAPLIVALSYSGYSHKRPVVFQNAWRDETTGVEYHLSSERIASPSKPYFLSEAGRLKTIVARSTREARSLASSLQAHGRIGRVVEMFEPTQRPFPQLRNTTIAVGFDLHQLAVKMCVGMARLFSVHADSIEADTRAFLADARPSVSPVRLVRSPYPALESHCPPMSHSIYLEGDPSSGRCYGVVRIFGPALQFYVPLSRNYSRSPFAALGSLDVRTFKEDFRDVPALALTETPASSSFEDCERFFEEWADRMNAEIEAAFGVNGLRLALAPRQTLAGLRVTLPIVWTEYSVLLTVALECVPDQQPRGPVSIPKDPSNWRISNDGGTTCEAIFPAFVAQWNKGVLARTMGREHSYVPPEIGPTSRLLFGDDFWCPVSSMSVGYRVMARLWRGTCSVPAGVGELDLAGRVFSAKVALTPGDIPYSRDPAWEEILEPLDPVALGNAIVVEPLLDAASLRFEDAILG